MRLSFVLLLQILSLSFISAAPAPAPAPEPEPDTTVTSPLPQLTICGDIVNSCNDTFTARQAYDCLISVPFDPAVATNFIRYYNDTIQFHSTLAFSKNPPSSYQQPAVDIEAGLKRIQIISTTVPFPASMLSRPPCRISSTRPITLTSSSNRVSLMYLPLRALPLLYHCSRMAFSFQVCT